MTLTFLKLHNNLFKGIVLLWLMLFSMTLFAQSNFQNDLLKKGSLNVSLITPKMVGTYDPSSNDPVVLKFDAANADSLFISGILNDFYHDMISIGEVVKLEEGKGEFSFPQKMLHGKGIKWLDLAIEYNGRIDSVHFSLAAMVPMGNDYTSDFKFGIAGIRYDSIPQLPWLYAAAEQVGVQFERKYADWQEIQPDSMSWDWSKLDAELAEMWKKGINRELLLTGTPPWAASSSYSEFKNKRRVPPHTKYWKEYVHRVVSRYQDTIKYYEIWNEPDFGFFVGTTPEYLEVLKVAHSEIKAVNDQLVVLSGGFADTSPRAQFFDRRGDLHKDAVRLGQNYFDIHGIHIHGTYDQFKSRVDGPLQDIRNQLKSEKPLWFNETAMHSTKIGQKEQAKTLFKKMNLAMARQAMGYCWFSLKDNEAFAEDDPEHNYGMITTANSPKAVYVVYNEMIRNLHDKTYVEDVDLGNGYEAFLFQDPDGFLLNAWKEEHSIGDQIIQLGVDESAIVSVSDLMGNEKSYENISGSVAVPINSDGVFIHIKNASKKPKVLKPVFKLDKALLKGENGKVRIQIPENLQEALEVKVVDKNQKLADFRLPIKKEINVITASDVLTFKVYSAARKMNALLSFPVSRPLLVSSGVNDSPDLILDNSEFVKNKYEHDPNTSHLVWKGAEDLSVNTWVGVKQDTVLLNFLVQDDVHKQPENGILQFKGDGIQLALRANGMNGFWELGFALSDSGKEDRAFWAAPEGYAAEAASDIGLTVERGEKTTTYRLKIPMKKFGLGAVQEEGFYMSFVVNDNDGEIREGWMELTPGLAGGKDFKKFKHVIFKE